MIYQTGHAPEWWAIAIRRCADPTNWRSITAYVYQDGSVRFMATEYGAATVGVHPTPYELIALGISEVIPRGGLSVQEGSDL